MQVRPLTHCVLCKLTVNSQHSKSAYIVINYQVAHNYCSLHVLNHNLPNYRLMDDNENSYNVL